MAKASVFFAARMNVVSRAMTSSADCSPSARKNTERSSIDEMLGWLAKADNAICTTHTTWKCLILLPMNYASGAIPSSNLWPIISAIFAIATCIVTCLQAGFATGSMPNLAAIAAARQAKDRSSGRLRIYVSSETHFSIAKAAALLGIGRENVRQVAVDERFRIRVDDLVAKITADLEAGYVPFCVAANAGTVNTGAVDPLVEVRQIADRFQLWMHVDGSYGAFAVLAKSARKLFAGLERADSIALDPHKWLYLPVDVGCVIYRAPEIARAAFAHEAEYTRIIGEKADEAFAFWDYGPELSRRFRALKVWMLLKGVGLDSLGEAIESNLACARYLGAIVRASDDFEMVAPVELSIFCFRHVPAQLRSQSPETIDAFNERLLVALQRDGSSYLSNATLSGRFALRGCVLNYRTTLRDMEILLDDLRRVARKEEGRRKN